MLALFYEIPRKSPILSKDPGLLIKEGDGRDESPSYPGKKLEAGSRWIGRRSLPRI
jgi:hypothetical protein